MHPLNFFGSNKMKKSLLSAVALTAMVAFSGTHGLTCSLVLLAR
jgi:hypothetical protein